MQGAMGLLISVGLTANLPRNLPVKKNFLNRLRFDRIMVMSLWPTLYNAGKSGHAPSIAPESAGSHGRHSGSYLIHDSLDTVHEFTRQQTHRQTTLQR